MRYTLALLGVIVSVCVAAPVAAQDEAPSYDDLYRAFAAPDHARWGEVPLWWWEGERMTKERVTAELETLAAEGVKAVCPIQRSPGRCDPQSFSPEWWELFAYTNAECKRLGMTLWAYDQVGYGHYGWLEKAAAQVNDPRTNRVLVATADGTSDAPIRVDLPEGKFLSARAYPILDGVLNDAESVDVSGSVSGKALEWTTSGGAWRVVAQVAEPFQTFYLSDTSGDAFIDMFYGELERTLGAESMGTSFVGIFQDEHPPTPRDIYTDELVQAFRERCGYDITRAIPALHFDVGPLTPKYRTDYLDVYLEIVEQDYWKRVYDWTWERGLLTSHDNWGRNNINRQSEGYIDYFRTQRWFSAPGYDDSGQHPLTERNYYDTKIASSIARLYARPRVWNEAFHSSGWGRTTDQTLTWLSAGMAFGANLYDEHGLYYATRASTWEHAAPDPHWRQPYWCYYDVLSDFVARSSYLMSQGQHVVDVGVHYPVASLLAGEPPNTESPDYNRYMALSRMIFYAGIDNDIVDDDSILASEVRDGAIHMGGNAYRALVFGPETTVRRGVLEKALELVESGGVVLFAERAPSASTEAGRDDPELAVLIRQLLGVDSAPAELVEKSFDSGGFCAFVPTNSDAVPSLITEHIDRDFIATGGNVFETHRQVGDVHVYLVQSVEPEPFTLEARCRVDGVPELWDPFTGEISPVQAFDRKDGFTTIRHSLEGNTATFFVMRPGDAQSSRGNEDGTSTTERVLPEIWEFSVIPTRDNRWGEFRWPPSNEVIGPEVRSFRYREEVGVDGVEAGWHTKDFDDADWQTTLYSTGPYWLLHACEAGDETIIQRVLESESDVAAGSGWQEVNYSKTIGLAKAAPWGGHSGYPDGHIDKNFIDLPEGRKLLFTRIHAPKAQRCGLRVELSNSTPRLWVNGEEQPFEEAVGNLPLREGENTVLLDLPDGGHGQLFVQSAPPTAASMAEAAQGGATPDIETASWVWAGHSQACYVRKVFELDEAPKDARLTVSVNSGFRLFVNGEKIEEEIGPWANWQEPETFTVTPLLREGRNTIAIWGQLFVDQSLSKSEEAFQARGIVLALKVRLADGNEVSVVTDESWRGAVDDFKDWESPDFDDSGWVPVTIRGKMGDAPWGMAVVDNVGAVTVPKRPLSIDLESPYLECFDEVPDLIYDVKRADDVRVGWYRFEAPPGLQAIIPPAATKAEFWVDGVSVGLIRGGAAILSEPAEGVSTVAMRVEMEPGAYAGAAFPEPIGVNLEGGTIGLGLWTDYALPTYSGIGVYTQAIELDQLEKGSKTWLDLGQVLVAAEVLVNGKNAGVRVAYPFKFDISGLVQPGKNTIEVRVANTIAPHYTTIPAMNLGPTESGLLGPVRLIHDVGTAS
jgi:hypothetical protein